MQKKTVAVYLGSKMGNNPIFMETAYQLGQNLAERGFEIVYGGANVGTMKALADGCMSVGGKITGVFPKGFKGKVENHSIEVQHTNLPNMIESEGMQDRKKIMEEMSNYCIILPGSYGTMDEFFEYAVNNQLGFHNKPIFILNLNGFYDPLKMLVSNMVENGFLPAKDENVFKFCGTIDEIISEL